MPASIKLQEEFGDDLQVIFVESQGANRSKMEGFALRRKWLGTNAMWTTEHPFSMSSRGLPKYALIGADGTIIEEGRHTNSQTSKLIADEIKSGRQMPAGTNKALKSAWKSFGKGDVGKAVMAAFKVRGKGDLIEEADAAIASFRKLTNQKLDKAEWCITNGYLVEAEDKLDGMLKGLKGAKVLHARALAIVERLGTSELEAELDACKKLDRILKKIHADGFGKNEAHKKALEKLLKSLAGTKAAKRAEHLISL